MRAVEQTTAALQRLLAGVELREPDAPAHYKPEPARAEGAEIVDETLLRLTLIEGKYHQVKRMVAAVSNRVEALHRSRIGAIDLPTDLAPGEWRWLTADEVAGLVAARR